MKNFIRHMALVVAAMGGLSAVASADELTDDVKCTVYDRDNNGRLSSFDFFAPMSEKSYHSVSLNGHTIVAVERGLFGSLVVGTAKDVGVTVNPAYPFISGLANHDLKTTEIKGRQYSEINFSVPGKRNKSSVLCRKITWQESDDLRKLEEINLQRDGQTGEMSRFALVNDPYFHQGSKMIENKLETIKPEEPATRPVAERSIAGKNAAITVAAE